ncbi:DJ-1/PfpI family protein [Halomonas sp. SS10-MC5]|uniref:DJ-1/PfpI family protein n=2 Tax=unclassified Halomonas TaxID=2609666 RepID=UPI0018D211B6|nr:DJ-1/PfpI family protein [Halomonas sp. SS10-MC5]QPP50545.1 DJ-1/PfpI family protein [Halomonas sp. SS10-MC5]
MPTRYVSRLAGLAVLILSMIAVVSWRHGNPGTVRLLEHPSLELPAPKGGRDRPLVAVLAANDGTETTDFMVPYGVLRESGKMEVVSVSTRSGPVQLHPVLTIRAEQTTEEFDVLQPDGADIVIVPALHRPDDPEAIRWLQRQAESGAVIVGVCDGVLTLAHAGLLQGKSATGHWFSLGKLTRRYRETTWIRDRRYVVDDRVVTTTGVSASIPVSLALVEAVAGAAQADRLALDLGIADFDAQHDSDVFGLSLELLLTLARNKLAFWNHERFEVPIEDGIDEIALALSADAWSRTYRSSAMTTHPSERWIRSRRGLVIEAETQVANAAVTLRPAIEPSAAALDDALMKISERYGMPTADLVAMQLEYAW